ncbi:hypothetical protein JOL62DRAFT_638219 [Phyllosticta paracitricarpa]|uniref:Uncharacterized protein n=2 Tax=Phyllosticta TaxID=121621 RepID=A0ABR1MGA3_9PEZI
MEPEEMALIQLVRREHNILSSTQRFQAVEATTTGVSSRLGLVPERAGLDWPCKEERWMDEMTKKRRVQDDPMIASTELHQLMRATIIARILSESICLKHDRDIFWPIRLLLRTERSTIYSDLNYVVDVVLSGKYPYILKDLQADMRCGENFLKQRKLPIRFLYAFDLGIIEEVLGHPDAVFAVSEIPEPSQIIDIKDFVLGFEPPLAPDVALGPADLASNLRMAIGPNLFKDATVAAVRRSDNTVTREATDKTVVRGTLLPVDKSASPALQNPLSKENSVIPHRSEAVDVANAKESNAENTRSIEPRVNVRTADAANAMDIDGVSTEQSRLESEVNKTIAITDPLDDEADNGACQFNQKDEDWFDEMPSPIRRGLALSMQPGLAPKSSLGLRRSEGIHYDETIPELFPEVKQSLSSEPSRSQKATDSENATQNDFSKPSGEITTAVDFTEVFSEVTDLQTKLKYNWVLNHLLGLGKEIQDTTLRAPQGFPMRGGEEVNIDTKNSARMDMAREEMLQNPLNSSFRPGKLPRVASDYFTFPTSSTSVAHSQSLGGNFPRSLRSLPPRFVLPRRQSNKDQNKIEAPVPHAEINSSPATIAAVDLNSSPGILLPFTRPTQPFPRRTLSQKGMPLKRITITGTGTGAGTPQRVDRQEPPSSGATIPMVDSNASPGILLPCNHQNPHRRQQVRRRQNRAGSPLKHVSTSREPSVMCSSSSSSTESRSPSKSPIPALTVPKSNLLNERSSGPLLSAFKVRSDPTNQSVPATTLVVSASGRDAGTASVRTTKPSRAKKSKKDTKDLRLSSASLHSAGARLPFLVPSYGNIRLPDRAALEGGPRTAPLPSTSSIPAWAAEQEANVRQSRSSFSSTASSFDHSSTSTSDSGIHPMHPLMQPPLNTGRASALPTLRDNTAYASRGPEKRKDGGESLEKALEGCGGGGKDLKLLRKLAGVKAALKRKAKQSGTDPPRSTAPDPLSTQDSDGENAVPARHRASGAGESLSTPQRTEAGTGNNWGVRGEDHGEQKANDGSSQIDSLSPVSSGGRSGDEEFARQQQLDEEARQRRLAEDQKRQQPTEPPAPAVYKDGFPPFPPWGNPSTDGAAFDTPPPPPPPKRRRFRHSGINAAGEFETNSLFTSSALSPFRRRPPGEESTPGITAPPIRLGRKRSWAQFLDESTSVGDGGAGGSVPGDKNDGVVKDEEE